MPNKAHNDRIRRYIHRRANQRASLDSAMAAIAIETLAEMKAKAIEQAAALGMREQERAERIRERALFNVERFSRVVARVGRDEYEVSDSELGNVVPFGPRTDRVGDDEEHTD